MQIQRKSYVILAAISFDDPGDLALQEATRYAEQLASAELHALHVVPHHAAESQASASVSHEQLTEAAAELRNRVERMVAARDLQVIGHIRAGAPVRSILQVASDIDADMIVVGTHKREGVRRFMLGSVAEQVLRNTHCAVLVATPKDHPAAVRAAQIEPPCPACMELRADGRIRQYWCERHSRLRLRPHIYETSDARRPMPRT